MQETSGRVVRYIYKYIHRPPIYCVLHRCSPDRWTSHVWIASRDTFGSPRPESWVCCIAVHARARAHAHADMHTSCCTACSPRGPRCILLDGVLTGLLAGYSRGTYRVLKGYSQGYLRGTHCVSAGRPRGRRAAARPRHWPRVEHKRNTATTLAIYLYSCCVARKAALQRCAAACQAAI